MAADKLFGDLPEQAKPQADAAPLGAPRLREPQRDQLALRAVDIESLVGEDHPVRLIWSYAEGLDLSDLENRIKSRGERPGHPATSPRLLLALWLYATSEGVGSARALERLCESHDAYRWLVGGVSVNYHTLSDFRVGPWRASRSTVDGERGGVGAVRPDRSGQADPGRCSDTRQCGGDL